MAKRFFKMINKNDWEQTKKRFEALWNNEITDRCCVSVKGYMDASKVEADADLSTAEALHRHWFDAEHIVQREVKKFENTFFGGESFPMVWANFGPSGHAALVNNMKFEPRPETMWFHNKSSTPSDLTFDDQGDYYKLVMQCIRYFTDNCNDRYIVSMPDNAGNLDVLAQVWGTENLMNDMLLDPEKIQSGQHAIQKIWERITSECFELTSRCNGGASAVGWLDTWAPGMHAQMQADLSVMIDETMFDSYAVPELTTQSEFLDYPLYHLDGQEQTRFIDQICSIEQLKMIQWTNVTGQPSPVHFIEDLKRIQSHGKALLVRLNDINDIEPIMTQLSSKGLYIVVEGHLESAEMVDDVMKLVNKLTHD